MSYIALYRKYRPRDFDDIVGQRPIVITLKNQITSGRVGHAYLFCGMRGTGKTSTARVFAKALNCQRGPTVKPCGKCSSCTGIDQGSMMDVIEMDAASHRGIDDIRDLREKVNFPPAVGEFKVYIIDEVHMLTTEAFNALLKTLEEPPSFVVFILATTEPHKLPATILSRCMRFDFTRVSTEDITQSLQKVARLEGVDAQRRALSTISEESQGSMRDALGLLDKALSFGGDALSHDDVLYLLGGVSSKGLFEMSHAILKKDSGRILELVDEVVSEGKDMSKYLRDLSWHFRNLLMINVGVDGDLLDMIDEDLEETVKISRAYSRERILSILDVLSEGVAEIKWAQNPRITVETSLVKLTLPELWDKTQGYISRISELEARMQGLEDELKLQDAPPIEPSDETVATVDVPPAVVDDPPATEKSGSDDLQKIKESWGKIAQELCNRGKRVVYSYICAGDISPQKIEGNSLILCYNGNDVYKIGLKRDCEILESIIEEVTGCDLKIGEFICPHETAGDNLAKSQEKDKEEREFLQGIVDYFGEELVREE